MAASLPPKKNYRCSQVLQQFYSGGPFAVSSDGSFIACTCSDSIKIVDSSNASIRTTIDCESDTITALCLSPDDKLLFCAGHSRQIRVWDLSTLKCLRSWKGHDGPVMSMGCHLSGGLLATGGADRKVLVWDVDGGFCTHYFRGHEGVITTILFHPDPNKTLLFSGSDDGAVRVWDLMTKKCISTLTAHNSTVTSLAVSDDGLILLAAGRDKVVSLWDLQNFACKKTIPTYEILEAVCIISPGNPFASFFELGDQLSRKKTSKYPVIHFLTIGERGIVRIWTSEGSVCIYKQASSDVTTNSDVDDSKGGFTAAVVLPLNQGLLCVTADQQFLFYHPEKLPEGPQLTLQRRLIGYNEQITDMKFLGEEEQFLAVATNLEQIRVYDLASMSCSYVLAGHTKIVVCLDTCVSSSGRTLIVSGSNDSSVRLWDSVRRCCIGVGIGHMGAVGAVAFSKKGRDFFVSGSSDRTLKVWSLDGLTDDGEQPASLKAKAVVAAHDKDINAVAISPDDKFVCSGSQDRTAGVWRLPDLVSVVVLKGHKRGIWSVEFSPTDKCVITASGDKTIKIWDFSNGSCMKTFEGHTSGVLRASFLTRGTQFVSCGGDGLLKLWTVRTNECIATYDQHEDKVWALAVGKKTEVLATGGSDAVVNLWYDSTASDKEEAFRKEEEGMVKGLELENAIADADYTRAIQIAFQLGRPHKLFELFAEVCRTKEAQKLIQRALSFLGKEEVNKLLEYAREWNTKPKMCHVAQSLLFEVFKTLPATEIIEIKGIGELLEGLIPYSQRHFSRVDRLVRSTYLLDYTLTGMSVIEPEAPAMVTEAGDKGVSPGVESDMKGTDNAALAYKLDEANGGELEEKSSRSKKRGRAGKSKDRSVAKKAKDRAADGCGATISTQA